ncbi:hypothetical protein U9M48_000772 [Paspalum notatum var. saurae]|uniref:Protein kinase domain-containing protein n=1 Tax=Paspalum notatum var. saurae TaxID=547442 RepID=A0AAQ3PFJ2_PASNO
MEHGTIAVKKLFNTHTIDEKMFHQEVTSLMLVRHQNIVRFLGYCSHTEEKAKEIMPGIFVLVEERKRMLCFEYISNGSLEDRITDELRGLEWNTRYQIIKGICDDDSMVPKITDFGLSRLDDKTRTTSAEPLMTLGYCAPEYQFHGKMSSKSDIYSLGVIILEIVTGRKEKPDIGKVLKRWKHRWNKSAADTLLAYKQVDTCLDVAKRCMHDDPTDRPNISDIVDDLNKIDSTEEAISDAAEYIKLEEMLQIEPLEMHLTFELNKRMSCSIELTNNTDGYFAFRISTTSLRPYHIHPTKGIVPPRSKRSVTIALQALEKTPSYNYRKDEFSVQSTTVDDSLTVTDISGSMFNEKSGNVVDDVNLTVVLDV